MEKKAASSLLLAILVISLVCSVFSGIFKTALGSSPQTFTMTTVAAQQTFVQSGFVLPVTVSVLKSGIASGTANVELFANSILVYSGSLSLDGLSSGSLNCLVYTSNLGIGNYTFTASVTPSNEPWATPNTLPSGVVGITYLGDLNGDFQVNFNDVITFVSKYIAYNTNGIYNPAIDYNHDGTINFNDIVLFVSYYTAYHNSAIISVNPATQQFPSAHVGDTIQINITVSNVQNLWAWDITPLTFNPSVLNLTQVTEGPFLKAGAQTLFIWTSRSLVDINEGRIVDTSDNRLEFTTQSGSGEIATLTFKVLSTGSSQISFGKITLDDDTNLGTVTQPYFQQIPVTGVNANIIVGNSS